MEAVQIKLPMSSQTKAMAAQDLPISTYEEGGKKQQLVQ